VTPLLEVRDLHAAYGNVHALKGISLTVGQGEIVALIGANGAGKSTTLRALSGVLRSTGGQILFEGKPATNRPAPWWVRAGVAHCPEGRQLFPRMSVEENLELGAYLRRDGDLVADFRRVFELFPILRERWRQLAGTLSGGEQQMLALGRALMSRPKLLLLDEPSLGLAPMLVQRMFATIRDIHATGTTVLLVEQNARLALQMSDRAYVLQIGEIVMSGTGQELLGSDAVRKAYLGE
jgi:branched-chain amino acid transport system ATP-binding protein